jgi:hypothetical protein
MKKTLLTLGLFLMVSAVAFSQAQVLSGNWCGDQEKSNYTLHENKGERKYTIEVNFLKPFENKPDVVVGVSALDADKNTNVRYSVNPKSISRDGFTIEIATWGETKIFTICGFWVAHAETSTGSEN